MIDVRVREDDSIEILDWQRERSVFLGGFLASSLKHSAVERDGVTVDVQKMAGPGNLACGTDEGYLQTANLLLRHRAETGW
jgi:hypothetical protein